MPISIITKSVLKWLRLDCRTCELVHIQDSRQQEYRPFGKVDLQWHKVGIAKQHAETFYVIESETKMVLLGRSAFSNDEEHGAGTYPLELGQQTPGTDICAHRSSLSRFGASSKEPKLTPHRFLEQKAQQEQKRIAAEKRRAEEQKQQEARDREKRQGQGPG